jgi:hypothetical protein
VACTLADELDSVRRGWVAAVGGHGDVLGYVELTDGFGHTRTAWDAEFGVEVEVLRELCRGVADAAKAYRGSDANAAARSRDAR